MDRWKLNRVLRLYFSVCFNNLSSRSYADPSSASLQARRNAEARASARRGVGKLSDTPLLTHGLLQSQGTPAVHRIDVDPKVGYR
jgi:hypothetical protein